MKMLLTGEYVDAEEAARWGLVNNVVEPKDLMARARNYAERIVASAPLSIQAAKELAVRAHDLYLADGLRFEQFAQRLLMASEDAAEGRQAFAERRQPEIGGR